MLNKLSAIARLFRRDPTASAVLAAVNTHAIGRPLLVEPAIGSRLVSAYLDGAVESPGPLVEGYLDTDGAGAVAIINVSGGLVSKPQPGLCDDGPANYEGIRAAFDEALDDEAVSAIVIKLESPGGMASGCFDLTDHIHASRGKKPILAVVDDYAYSAAYAIAAACDEIWVTRTGGVGSVGVVCYHFDQTGYNDKVGIKVTPIFAGAHKVDFSPHQPLSDAARDREQAEVDTLYGLFVQSVANYRDMDVEAVRVTDALTFTGSAAIDAGLADHLGLLEDAIDSLKLRMSADAVAASRRAQAEAKHAREVERINLLMADAGAAGAGEAAEARRRAEAEHSARLAVIAKEREDRARQEEEQRHAVAAVDRTAACTVVANASLPGDIAAALLDKDSGITGDTVQARIQHALAVTDLCVAYGDRSLARDYIVRNTNIEVVRAQLQAAKAEDGAEIDTTPSADLSGKSALASWGNTIKKFGGNPQ